MNIIISGLHVEKSPKLHEYAKKKISKLSKYYSRIQSINVRLIAKPAHRGKEEDYYCEIEVAVPGKVLEIVDSERAMDKAIDKAVERMKRTLVKYHEKRMSKDHRRGILAKFLNRLRP